jgi:predicted nucleic acid-binding Zn ribbon protein
MPNPPKNKKICVVCGREFFSPPSDKTITCSPECRSIRRSEKLHERTIPDEVRKKISEKAKMQDRSKNLSKGTAAAMKSEKGGRGTKNSSAKDWTLYNLNTQKRYEFTNLREWLRQNLQELFGEEPTDKNVDRIYRGLQTIKRNMKIGNRCITYLGEWQVVAWDDRKNCEKLKITEVENHDKNI